MSLRENTLNEWLISIFGPTAFKLNPLAGDASFRRYFRLTTPLQSWIVMDAPPERESLDSFISVQGLLAKAKIDTPTIHHCNLAAGFLLLDDLGDNVLLPILNVQNANDLYLQAIAILINMQANTELSPELPLFDAHKINDELSLFKIWFLEKYLHLTLNAVEEKLIDDVFARLTQNLLAQAQVFVHRDYHSRNIMMAHCDNKDQLVLIDFQDAVVGPITYDLVSLLKDCYIQWPKEQVLKWVTAFHQRSNHPDKGSLTKFLKDFEVCGLQRHLKVLGIFARLYLRDGKAGYLNDLPLTLSYVMEVLKADATFADFYNFMQTRVQLP